ncbi:MAG: hypothetical protein NTU44_15505 [Bacteroidetes bacterium]|nr:hypothetical protein [Bacteroidota bacterium]
MKTIMNTLMILTAIMVMGLTSQAQTRGSSTSGKENTKVTNASTPGTFVDKNNNGICDNFEARPTNGRGKNFIDNNGDGICDNRQNAGIKGASSRTGNHVCRHGNGRGNGNCCGRGPGNRHRFGGNAGSADDVK